MMFDARELQEVGVIFQNRAYRVVIEVNNTRDFINSFKDGFLFVSSAEFVVNFTTRIVVIKQRLFEKQLDFDNDSLIYFLRCQPLITSDVLYEKEEQHGIILCRDWEQRSSD